MSDPIDRIMEVMEASFEPQYGEAWNRRQVSDALIVGNCRYLLLDEKGRYPIDSGPAAGFLLSRGAADEEEILLVAVRPEYRRKGIASSLLDQFLGDAKLRGMTRLFLEMREGNPAEFLYRKHGFAPVGRRPNYYNRGSANVVDAITFAREI